jgi:hypothetical protein
MKLGFYVFGLSMGGMGVWTLYDMGQPEKDSEGKDVDDEYSHLPTFDQYKGRILKNLNYYQKVGEFTLLHNLIDFKLNTRFSVCARAVVRKTTPRSVEIPIHTAEIHTCT